MQQLLIATTNPGKLHEFRLLLQDLPVKLVSLTDVGITIDVEEDKKTYKGNSQKKALFYAKLSGLPALSDDGGMEIVAFNGAPGIKSRRWLGHHATDKELIKHMKKVARELPDDNRKAYFKTIVSFAMPNGKVWSCYGEVEGIITKEPQYDLVEGYPYRSFFYLPKLQKFYQETELTIEEQKEYNHRYKAVSEIKKIIKKLLKKK